MGALPIDRDPTERQAIRHDAGCVYGGFSCGYWMVADGCDVEEHWERHIVMEDGRCPCGHVFPDVAPGEVFCRFEDD